MGEKHVKYTMTGSWTNEVMHRMFDFVSASGPASGQNAVRFAYGSTATSVSSTLGYGGSPVSVNFASGSFIVIEPSATMPSGYRWQLKLENISATQLGATLSTVGGWEGSSTKNFIAASTNNPPGITPPVTDRIAWSITAPTAGYLYLISSADLDTYGASATPATYFRIMEWQSGGAEASQFFTALHVGGYIPTNASVAFAIGTQITIIQTGAGQLTITATTPATTTILSTGATAASPKLRAQYSSATLIKTGTDAWYVVGDIA